MQSLFLSLTLLLPAGTSDDFDSRERHPLAPSLPLLTEEEEAHIQKVIDRFIQYEMGKLTATEGAKAVADLKALGPEAIPGLLHGLNRAANLGGSCPAVVIARKLAALVNATEDRKLLDFVRDSVGLGVSAKRHKGTLNDLRVTCMLRKSYLVRNNIVYHPPVPLPPKTIMKEMEQRKEGKELVLKTLVRESDETLKEHLKNEQAAVRLQAVQQVSARKLRYGPELIDLLRDRDADVRRAAHQALVRLAGGQDFGPEAAERWRGWWEKKDR